MGMVRGCRRCHGHAPNRSIAGARPLAMVAFQTRRVGPRELREEADVAGYAQGRQTPRERFLVVDAVGFVVAPPEEATPWSSVVRMLAGRFVRPHGTR